MLSTEELKQLLDEATPGEWAYEVSETKPWHSHVIKSSAVDRLGNRREMVEDNSYMSMERVPDFELMARSRELAAEVIRLREENARLSRIESMALEASENGVLAGAGLYELDAALEGDQK